MIRAHEQPELYPGSKTVFNGAMVPFKQGVRVSSSRWASGAYPIRVDVPCARCGAHQDWMWKQWDETALCDVCFADFLILEVLRG